MKIALVKPIVEKSKRIYTVHPISLGYLAAALRKKHNVSILDCENLGYGEKEFSAFIKQQKPDFIGITLFSHNKIATMQTIEIIRRHSPDTPIVAGGPHVNAVGAGIFQDLPDIDYAIRGEAEKSIVQLAEFTENHANCDIQSIQGLIYRDSSGKAISNDNSYDSNLDQYDPMCYDLIGIENYFKGLPQGMFYKHKNLVSIITSRGCPYPCTFCASWVNNGKKVRYRSIKNVLQEIDFLSNRYHVREIHILDDNFTFKKEYAWSFCEEIIKRGYKMHFALPNGIRLDKVDKELLQIMKRAGFYALSFGIESGSDQTLKKIKKLETTEYLKKQIETAKKVGFRITGTFIIGFPWETKEDILLTLSYAKSLKIDHAAFGNFTPLPATKITDDLIKSGELNKNYEVPFTWGDITYSPRGISPAELKKLQKYCVLKFYFPWRFHKILLNLKLYNILYIIRRAILLFK
ncbi:MAG: radical SAM protein [bacterium]